MSQESVSQRILEGQVEQLAGLLKIPIVSHGTARNAQDLFDYFRLIKNVPYTNIWGYVGYIEFVLEMGLLRRHPIECKYQNKNGSTDDKLVKTYLDFGCCFDEPEPIILYDGPKTDMRKINKLKAWAQKKEFQLKPKTIHIMNWNEFSSWLRALHKEAA